MATRIRAQARNFCLNELTNDSELRNMKTYNIPKPKTLPTVCFSDLSKKEQDKIKAYKPLSTRIEKVYKENHKHG